MTDKYAIFLDIDGTLIQEGHKIHQNNIEAIKKVRSLGHYVFLNTGRALSWVTTPNLVELNQYDGIISGIGTNIMINGKSYFEKTIDSNAVGDIIDYFIDTKHCFFVSGLTNGFVINPDSVLSPYFFTQITSAEDYLTNHFNEKIQKVEIFGKNITDSEKNFLAKYLDVYDHKFYIECCPKGTTKSDGMKKVCDILGIPKENIIAMGDSINDMDMLKSAGISVAMGNAIEQVKDIANFVSTPCIDGGVAYALQKLILDKQQF